AEPPGSGIAEQLLDLWTDVDDCTARDVDRVGHQRQLFDQRPVLRLGRAQRLFSPLALGDLGDGDEHLRPRVLRSRCDGQLDRVVDPPAAKGLADRLACESRLSRCECDEFLCEQLVRLAGERIAEIRKELLLARSLRKLHSGLVDLDDLDEPCTLEHSFRVRGEVRRQVSYPGRPKLVDARLDGGEILLPEGDGALLEQLAIALLAGAQCVFRGRSVCQGHSDPEIKRSRAARQAASGGTTPGRYRCRALLLAITEQTLLTRTAPLLNSIITG